MDSQDKHRFTVVVDEHSSWSARTQVLRDTHTGVQYLFHRNGNAAGLTVLLGADGRPC